MSDGGDYGRILLTLSANSDLQRLSCGLKAGQDFGLVYPLEFIIDYIINYYNNYNNY